MKRPYECKVAGCPKNYTTRFSLRRHIASHATTKQHVCVLCMKTFTLAQYLKEHMYIHTQQKPFKCDFEGCDRSFRQAGKLSMHKKLHQNIIFTVQKVKKRSLRNKLHDCSGNPHGCDHDHEMRDDEHNACTSTNPEGNDTQEDQNEESLTVYPRVVNYRPTASTTAVNSAVSIKNGIVAHELYSQVKFEHARHPSKVKMPNEILVSKLLDSLETPQIIS